MMRVFQSLALILFGFDVAQGFTPFGSLINHVFSCDCFIALPDPPQPIRQQPVSVPKHSMLNISKMEPLKNSTNEFENKHPKLIIFKNSRQKFDLHKEEKMKEATTKATKMPKLASMLTLENMLELLEESKKYLKDKGWLQNDALTKDTSEYLYAPTETTEETSPLFSMSHGILSQNFRRLGQLMELFDKFDCRCAGNFSAVLNAKKFVRFTVAHL